MYDATSSVTVEPDGTVVAVAVPVPNLSTPSDATAAITTTADGGVRSPLQQQPFSIPTSSPLSTNSNDVMQQAAHANARLSRALDLDERQETKAAIEEYMAAAEMYLRCIRIIDDEEDRQQLLDPSHLPQTASNSNIKPVLKRRLAGALGKHGRNFDFSNL